jgi:type IV pilus assembly protein PilN
MIKINLLQEPDDSTAVRRATSAIGGAFFVGLVLLVCIQYFIYRGQISQSKREISGLKADLAVIKEKTREVAELDSRKVELEDIAQSIAKVKLQQIGPVRLLEDLNYALPERAWITSYVEEKGRVTLTGLALNNFVVSQFQSGLEAYPYLKDISLRETVEVYLNKVITYNTADSSYSFFIAPVEKVKDVEKVVRAEADERGLKIYPKPPPSSVQSETNRTAGPETGGDGRVVGWGRFIQVPEGIYFWELSQGTEARRFTIEFSYDFMKLSGGTNEEAS